MEGPRIATRLRALPTQTVLGHRVRVAVGVRARLLGLALLAPEEAGAGLLLSRCTAVHTFGMRFPLDIHFLDRTGAIISSRLGVGRRRFVSQRGADAVLELPSPFGESRNLHP
jgi:hypothetical protein